MATIQGVYVALFGRPADPAGLAYFNSITNNGANLSSIASLAGTAEYQARFAGQSNTQIVTAIYQSLFNRAPEAAGLSFFVDALNKGTLNINNVAIAILDGAQGDDKIVITNKLTAADNFTKALDTPTEIGAYQGNGAAAQGRTFLAGVTKDTTTIPSATATDAAVLAVVTATPGSTGTTGVTINLTNAATVVGPNNADPATKSTAGDDTINTTAISNSTNIDAGAGTDTLIYKATANAGAAATAAGGTPAAAADLGGKPTFAGVEKVFVTVTGAAGGDGVAAVVGPPATPAATGGAAGNFALDVSGSTGIKELWNDTSTGGTAGTTNGAGAGGAGTTSVTFNNIALGTAVGVKGDTTVASVFNFAGATGASDSATLVLQGATGTTTKAVTINGIETLNVSVNGASKVNVTDSTLDKVVATGTGNLDFTTGSTTVKAVDASALNGTITLDVSSAANGVTVTGSKFADSITLNAGGGATDKDVIVYNSGNKSTAAVLDVVTNFTSGEDKFDVKAFALTAPAAVTNLSAVPAAGAAAVTSIAKFDNGGTTTIYVDSDKSGTFDANDLVIKLAAVVDVKVTDFTFA